ncbi:hypothetical protein K402DRAFT_392715 [Aulographum hederae CBS 113979]|uniref:BTB domain-containing protein n=1 Tax=Aulographum hederae CBS 113979 TaxID=1176131 RepID=A0A6G1H321_9PEZI|nr:hypothetical protein K402DRAFT_392715 [Aulographum hederae CBS 113979]
MADPEAQIPDVEDTPIEDVEMGAAEDGEGAEAEESMLPDIEPDLPARETFVDFFKSPIVELIVGTGEDQTVLTAHQAFLHKSPYFAELLSQSSSRRVDLPHDDLTAVGSFLEYLYNDEYFPKRLHPHSKDSALETDPTLPSPDDNGVALLRHARVYTLADKFGLPALKSLAHSKIHRTGSTARGEMAYARFVYKETSAEDTTIRKPVAAFWATRSHVLRHEADAKFRSMCLEFPQFAFDVLTLVLDQKEKGSGSGGGGGAGPSVVLPVPASGRKRARVSQG